MTCGVCSDQTDVFVFYFVLFFPQCDDGERVSVQRSGILSSPQTSEHQESGQMVPYLEGQAQVKSRNTSFFNNNNYFCFCIYFHKGKTQHDAFFFPITLLLFIIVSVLGLFYNVSVLIIDRHLLGNDKKNPCSAVFFLLHYQGFFFYTVLLICLVEFSSITLPLPERGQRSGLMPAKAQWSW